MVEFTKTMETLNASASAANEAAETALLASEGIVALSSRVSDDVRSAVQQAIESATPPPAPAATLALPDEDEEAAPSPLKEHAALIPGVLTLLGVGYLAMQNMALTEQLGSQALKLSALEEQLAVNSGEAGNHAMLLAEQSQKIEESIKALAQPAPVAATPTEPDPTLVAALEQLQSSVETAGETLSILQQRSDEAAQQPEVPAAEPVAETTPITTIATEIPNALTLDQLQSTLQQQLDPLQQSLNRVEQKVNEQQPAINAIHFEKKVEEAEKEKPKKRKTLPYRFP